MCELQVLDNTHPRYAKLDPRQFHGSAYGITGAKKGFLKKIGEWNEQEVIVRGYQITVFLNDEIILDTDVSKVNNFMAKKNTRDQDHVQKRPAVCKKDHFHLR